jgi:hypothetical protein
VTSHVEVATTKNCNKKPMHKFIRGEHEPQKNQIKKQSKDFIRRHTATRKPFFTAFCTHPAASHNQTNKPTIPEPDVRVRTI